MQIDWAARLPRRRERKMRTYIVSRFVPPETFVPPDTGIKIADRSGEMSPIAFTGKDVAIADVSPPKVETCFRMAEKEGDST